MALESSDSELCAIAYSEEYRKTVGILRALLAKKEYSERALAAADAAIALNPAHYTVWAYRYDIVAYFALKLNDAEKGSYVDLELEKNDSFAIETPKNYQIWNYRELLIKLHPNPNPKRELPLIEVIIAEDNKNYHTWAYRTWLVKYFNLFDSNTETQFVDLLLAADIRNNSAWNFRFFLKFSQSKNDAFEEEVEYAKNAILKAPQNQSSWNYLTGVYEHCKRDLSELELFCLQFVDFDTIDLESQEKLPVQSIDAVALLQKIYAKSEKQKSLKALDILTKIDPIRARFWEYKRSLLHG